MNNTRIKKAHQLHAYGIFTTALELKTLQQKTQQAETYE